MTLVHCVQSIHFFSIHKYTDDLSSQYLLLQLDNKMLYAGRLTLHSYCNEIACHGRQLYLIQLMPY